MKTTALILSTISIPAQAGFFGYYHADSAGVLATRDHTNVIYIQTGNPTQPIDQIAAIHRAAKMIVEFGVLTAGRKVIAGAVLPPVNPPPKQKTPNPLPIWKYPTPSTRRFHFGHYLVNYD